MEGARTAPAKKKAKFSLGDDDDAGAGRGGKPTFMPKSYSHPKKFDLEFEAEMLKVRF